MSLVLGGRGKSILGYVIAGILLSLVVGTVAYTFSYIVKTVGQAYVDAYEAATGSEVEKVSIQVGNETAVFPKPSNPALSALASAILSVLAVVGNVLATPLLLAILVALTLIAYALATR